MSKLKVLCTGSGGCLISNFIRKAVYDKQPFEFVSIDNCQNRPTLNNIYINYNHKFQIADITDKHILDVIFEVERPDIVLHGAEVKNINDPLFISSNIIGTQNIIDACEKWQVQKLLFISTDQVYGTIFDKNPLETDQTNPSNKYAIIKRAAEDLIKYSDVNYNILRMCNILGSRQSLNRFLPSVVKNILEGKQTYIYGQGQQLRNWMHVDDAGSAILKILDADLNNSIFNLSSEYEFSNLELYQEICNCMESGHNLLSFKNNDGQDHLYSKFSSNAQKLKNLGWKPSFKFRQAVKHTVKWFVDNKWTLNLNKD